MPFILFSWVHFVAVFASGALIYGFLRRAQTFTTPTEKQRGAWLLVAALGCIYVLLTVTKLQDGTWSVQGNLPLHLCDISAWTLAYALLRRSFAAFEAGYYWGLTGGFLAFATPEVHFVDAFMVPFFLWHAILIAAPLYLMHTEGFRPRHRGIFNVWGLSFLLALPMFAINAFLGSNYMFLAAKPLAANVLPLPDPPYHIAIFAIGLILVFYGLYGLSKLISQSGKTRSATKI